MMRQFSARRLTALCVSGSLIGFAAGGVQAATYTTPRQLLVGDIYQLNPDSATGDEQTTCPKIDLNDGAAGDNPYFKRTNVARAHLGGCSGRYWYTSNFQMLCTDVPPVNTCGAGPCIDEPNVNDPQYVDYAPPFGAGTSELTPGRYRIIGEYRNTTSRAPYPAEYIVTHANGTTTVLKSQLDGTSGACLAFDIGTFDLNVGSYVRVNDTGNSSLTFNQMRFVLQGPLGGIPYVNAGIDQTVILPSSAALTGTANDDGAPGALTTTWSKLSGPGTVTFGDASQLSTTADFSVAGSYVLRLTASDTLNTVTDDITVTVLAEGGSLTYSTQYEFDADPSTAAGVIDANPGDVNGAGLLTKIGTGWGNAGSGISGGILRYIDSTSSGNHGFYFQNGGANLSYTIDMAVRVNAGVSGTTNRRSMGFSAGNAKNLGLRLHKINDGATSGCTNGSLRFVAASGGTGDEACTDFSTSTFHRVRVAVNANANTFTLYDLDAQVLLTSATGSSGVQSWAAQIDNLGGYHIGAISGSNTTSTDFELDYFRVLLGVAVESPTTPILPIGLCNDPFADADDDGDVDMDDFARFQNCYTGDVATVDQGECQCFDHNGDTHVNETDFNAFSACGDTSRAGVAADVMCDGP